MPLAGLHAYSLPAELLLTMTSRVRSSHSSHSQPTMMYSSALLLSLLASAHGFASTPEPGSVCLRRTKRCGLPVQHPVRVRLALTRHPHAPTTRSPATASRSALQTSPPSRRQRTRRPDAKWRSSVRNRACITFDACLSAITPHAHPRATIDTPVLACARRRRNGRSVLGTALG